MRKVGAKKDVFIHTYTNDFWSCIVIENKASVSVTHLAVNIVKILTQTVSYVLRCLCQCVLLSFVKNPRTTILD